jgi:thiol-disulfide isomerase/thioredoxin
MALTESKMLPLGSPLPPFSLLNVVDGATISGHDFVGQPVLVMFICNHCPYVKHVRPELIRIGEDYKDSELRIVAIQSNDIENYPDDSPENMKLEALQAGFCFPYLFDESQDVAIRFSAACTPDFFLFDFNHRLVYRGRLDETRPNRIASGVYDSQGVSPHGRDLRAAIDAVLAGQRPNEKQYPSMGCNLKWRPGGGPSTFRVG